MDTIRAAFGWSSVKDDDGSDTSGGESSDACAIVTSTGLEELRKQFPNEGQEVLEGYLRMRKGDVGAASTQYKSTIAWKKQPRLPRRRQLCGPEPPGTFKKCRDQRLSLAAHSGGSV